MAGVDVEYALNSLVPDWDVSPPEYPAGNYVARKLRGIMDDSVSVFPESVYSSPAAKASRWRSNVRSDYVDMTGRVNGDNFIKGKGDKAEYGRMFMNWKVPDRVTTSSSRGGSRASLSADEAIRTGVPPARADNTPQLPRIGSPPRGLARSMTSLTPRQGLARIHAPASAAPRYESPAAAFGVPPAPAPSVADQTQHVLRQNRPKKQKSYKTGELLKRYYHPSAEEWLANASESERHMVEKTLRLLDRDASSKRQTDNTLNQWLSGATDGDRKVALDFFQTVTGSQMLGDGQQNEKVTQVIDMLKRGRQFPGAASARQASPRRAQPDDREREFRYLRLLSPKTRAEKWMHQTWHHLPNYRDTDPVANRSSMYTEPHKPTPLHFVIHPDWG